MESGTEGNLAESLGQIGSKGDWLKRLGKLGVSSATFLTTFLSSHHHLSY